jgi:hypothetical protein
MFFNLKQDLIKNTSKRASNISYGDKNRETMKQKFEMYDDIFKTSESIELN